VQFDNNSTSLYISYRTNSVFHKVHYCTVCQSLDASKAVYYVVKQE